MAASLGRWRGCRIAATPLSLPKSVRVGWLLSSTARAAGALSTQAQHLTGGPAYPTTTPGAPADPRTAVSVQLGDRAAGSAVKQLARSSGGRLHSQHALPGALRSALPTVSLTPVPIPHAYAAESRIVSILARTAVGPCGRQRGRCSRKPPHSITGRKECGHHCVSVRATCSAAPGAAIADMLCSMCGPVPLPNPISPLSSRRARLTPEFCRGKHFPPTPAATALACFTRDGRRAARHPATVEP